MASNMIHVNLSGTSLGITGSQTTALVILCGVSGNSVIPLRTMADGTLLTSGPQ